MSHFSNLLWETVNVIQAKSFKLTHWNQQRWCYSPVKIQNFLWHRYHIDKTQNRATRIWVVGMFLLIGYSKDPTFCSIIVYRGPFAVNIEKSQPRLTKHDLWRRMGDKIRWQHNAAPSTRTIKYVKFYFFTKQTLFKKFKILIHRPEILINTL